jgi:hypothetical protein
MFPKSDSLLGFTDAFKTVSREPRSFALVHISSVKDYVDLEQMEAPSSRT